MRIKRYHKWINGCAAHFKSDDSSERYCFCHHERLFKFKYGGANFGVGEHKGILCWLQMFCRTRKLQRNNHKLEWCVIHTHIHSMQYLPVLYYAIVIKFMVFVVKIFCSFFSSSAVTMWFIQKFLIVFFYFVNKHYIHGVHCFH